MSPKGNGVLECARTLLTNRLELSSAVDVATRDHLWDDLDDDSFREMYRYLGESADPFEVLLYICGTGLVAAGHANSPHATIYAMSAPGLVYSGAAAQDLTRGSAELSSPAVAYSINVASKPIFDELNSYDDGHLHTAGRDWVQSIASIQHGHIAVSTLRFDDALESYKQTVDLLVALNQLECAAVVEFLRARVCRLTADSTTALHALHLALCLWREEDSLLGQATALDEILRLAPHISPRCDGFGMLRSESNRVYQALGEPQRYVRFLRHLAMCCRHENDIDSEARLLHEADSVASNDSGLQCEAKPSVLNAGPDDVTITSLSTSLAAAKRTGDIANYMTCVRMLTDALASEDEREERAGILWQTVGDCRELNSEFYEGWAYAQLGQHYEEVNDYANAVASYEAALKIAETLGLVHQIYSLHCSLGQLAVGNEDYAHAAVCFFNAARSSGDDALSKGRALGNCGAALVQNDAYHDAIRRLKEAVQLFEKVDAGPDMAIALMNLCVAELHRHNWKDAIRVGERGALQFEQLGRKYERGLADITLAWAYDKAGQRDDATAALARAKEILLTPGVLSTLPADASAHPALVGRLASRLIAEGDLFGARRLCISGSAWQTSDDALHCWHLLLLGTCSAMQGHFDEAIDLFQDALHTEHSRTNASTKGLLYLYLGDSYRCVGQLESARSALEEALSDTHDRAERAGALNSLAGIYLKLGDAQHAVDCMHAAMELASDSKNPVLRGSICGNAAALLYECDHIEEAVALSEQSDDHFRSAGDAYRRATNLINLGILKDLTNDVEGAITAFGRAAEMAREIGDTLAEGQALVTLAAVRLGIWRDREQELAQRSPTMEPGAVLECMKTQPEDIAATLRYTVRAIQLLEETNARAYLQSAWSLKAELERKRGNVTTAAKDYVKALAYWEEQRADLISPLHKAYLQERSYSLFWRGADANADLSFLDPIGGYKEAAYRFIEAGRNRVLLDSLGVHGNTLLGPVGQIELPAGSAELRYFKLEDAFLLIVRIPGEGVVGGPFYLSLDKVHKACTRFMEITERLQHSVQIVPDECYVIRKGKDYLEDVQKTCEDLGEVLLPGPIIEVLRKREITRLLIVPDDALWNVPFAALRVSWDDTVSPLIGTPDHPERGFEVFYCPSFKIYQRCCERAAKGTRVVEEGVHDLLIVSNPNENRPDRALPRTPEFFDKLQKRLPETVITTHLSGRAATAGSFCEYASGRSAVVFCGHGEHSSVQPLHSRLHFFSESEASEALTADALLRQPVERRMDACRLLILATCWGGKVGRNRDADWTEVSGLPTAFFERGVSSIVGALWPATLTPCLAVVSDILRNACQGVATSTALREAQLKLLADESYANPYFWGPFCVLGDFAGLMEREEASPNREPAKTSISSRGVANRGEPFLFVVKSSKLRKQDSLMIVGEAATRPLADPRERTDLDYYCAFLCRAENELRAEECIRDSWRAQAGADIEVKHVCRQANTIRGRFPKLLNILGPDGVTLVGSAVAIGKEETTSKKSEVTTKTLGRGIDQPNGQDSEEFVIQLVVNSCGTDYREAMEDSAASRPNSSGEEAKNDGA